MEERPKKIVIRKADVPDVNPIFRLLEACYAEGPVEWPTYDRSRLFQWISTTLVEGEVWVADLDGRVLGSVSLMPFRFPWSNEIVLTTEWIYVLKKFRKRGTGRMLATAMIRSADEKKARLAVGTYSGRDADWRDEFIEQMDEGMVYGGGSFFRSPNGG